LVLLLKGEKRKMDAKKTQRPAPSDDVERDNTTSCLKGQGRKGEKKKRNGGGWDWGFGKERASVFLIHETKHGGVAMQKDNERRERAGRRSFREIGGEKKVVGLGRRDGDGGVRARRTERKGGRLTSESVEGASLTLEGVDDVHRGHGLSAGVLGVGDGVTDDVLKEDLEDTACLLVDLSADALDSSTTCETTDGGLGDALDVIAQDLSVALGSGLSESLSSLSAS